MFHFKSNGQTFAATNRANHLAWRAATPYEAWCRLKLAVDAHRGKSGRQRARRHDVVGSKLHLLGIKIAHHTRSQMRGPHGQPGMVLIDEREVDQLFQRRYACVSDIRFSLRTRGKACRFACLVAN
jgi:hypothetical protein